MKKVLAVILLLLVVLIVVIYGAIWFYFIREQIVPTYSIVVTEMHVENSCIEIETLNPGSADYFTSFDYHYKDGVLCIKIYRSYVPSGWDGVVRIQDEFEDISSIFLMDNQTVELIWER